MNMSDKEDTAWNDRVSYKSIVCTNIPDLLLNKLVAKQYFSQFGKITRLIWSPSCLTCTVTYKTEDQAERALINAGDFDGVTFTVEYADCEEGHVQNKEVWVDAEVHAKLASMGQLNSSVPPQTLTRATPATFATTMGVPLSAKPTANYGVCEKMLALIRRPARTDEEKYRVLDARDKLMRLTKVKQTDITKAVSTKGTCPDMCPEKERLIREFHRQVSMFEMSDKCEEDIHISHRCAIKEYSRSSADQEAPLAHELRPEKVLKMTMLYMMHNILNLCDDAQVQLAEWFHFVWDRTRSIRKDITQQEVCSLGTVELVEQCVRFHIHCAARLVAEDPSVFDKKLNAENLTKCLQSLKYMYHDLRIKNTICPNEAEFRSYIILLNMGDSNFLWELKHLPEQIQKADEIKRAIKFYNVLQNNNFVRFFEMIRQPQTSYLSSCILLGYFNKLRWRAIDVMNKTHNGRKNTVVLPLKYLTKILGFEDAASATDYCRYHGLECDNDEVMLKRLKKPDIEYCMDRALQLVESKRTVSVGECVCGHPLEPADIFERHVPQNSFDENGMLKTLGRNVDDQHKFKIKMQEKEQTSNEKPSSTAAPTVGKDSAIQVSSPAFTKQFQVKETLQPNSTNCSIYGESQCLDNETTGSKKVSRNPPGFGTPTNSEKSSINLNTTANDIFSAAAKETAHKFQPQQFDILSELQPQRQTIADCKDKRMQQLEKDKYLGQQKVEEELKRQRLEAVIKRKKALEVIEQNAEEKAQNVLEQVSNIAEEEFGKYHSFEQRCQNLLNTLLDEAALQEIGELANEEYVAICNGQKLLSRYFERWVEFLRKKKQQRALMEATPIWVTTDTREEQVAKLKHPNQEENLKMIKRYRQGEPCNFKLLLPQNPDMFCRTEKVNIFKLISSHMVRRNILRHGHLQTEKYFKLVLSLPSDTDELMGFESMCNKWLEIYIKGHEQEDNSETAPYICAMDSNLALCVRKVTGVPPRNERDEHVRNECDNADGFICFISVKNLHNTRKRVQHLFKLSKIQRSVPVCFVVYNAQFSEETELGEILEVESLVENGTVSAYRFCGCLQSKNEFSFAHHLEKALQFVARESSFCNTEADALEMQKFQSWLEIGLGEIWLLWQKSFEQNPVFAKVCCSPQYVVDLYNEALRRLRELASENFNDSPEFPVELRKFVPAADLDILYGIEHFPANWKAPQRQAEIAKLLSLLTLPDLDAPDNTEIEALQIWLVNYASRCMPQDENQALVASYEAIKAMTELLNSADLQEFELADRFHLINFLPVIKAVSFIHIRTVVNCFIMDNAHHLPAEIIYRRQAFLDYQTMPWWLNYGMITAVKFDITHNETQLDAKTIEGNADALKISPEIFDEMIKQAEAILRKVYMQICASVCRTVGVNETIHQFESATRQLEFRWQELLQNINEVEGGAGDTNAALQQGSVDSGEERTLSIDSDEIEAIMGRGFNISKKAEAYQYEKERLDKIVLRNLRS